MGKYKGVKLETYDIVGEPGFSEARFKYYLTTEVKVKIKKKSQKLLDKEVRSNKLDSLLKDY